MAIPVPDVVLERLAELLAQQLEGQARREYLDSTAAAEYLAMPRGRLDKLCSGAIRTVEPIPVHREGSRRLFIRQELDAWIDSAGSELA
jgi:hypothetical protein